MTELEMTKAAEGLKRVYSENRTHKTPLDLHLCGLKSNSVVIKRLSNIIPTLLKKGSPTEIHSKCFTELFPKDRLVMLTPHSDKVLEYNADDIYIVGGIVDIARADPLTLSKSKQLGIRSARLPLDNLKLQAGDSRELKIATVVAIIRECQTNKSIDDVIQKCVTLKSEIIKEREMKKEKENMSPR